MGEVVKFTRPSRPLQTQLVDERLRGLVHRHDVEIGTAWMERGDALLTSLPGASSITVAAASSTAERNVALATLLVMLDHKVQTTQSRIRVRAAEHAALSGIQHEIGISTDATCSATGVPRRYWPFLVRGLRMLITDADIAQARREGWGHEQAAEAWQVPIRFVRIRLRDARAAVLAEAAQFVRTSLGRQIAHGGAQPEPSARGAV